MAGRSEREKLMRRASNSAHITSIVRAGDLSQAVQTLAAESGSSVADAQSVIDELSARLSAYGHPDQADKQPSSAAVERALRLPGNAEQPPKKIRFDKQPAPEGTQWLSLWKGRKHKTRKELLNAACQACGHTYQLTGGAMNAFASSVGAGAAFSRFIDVADLWANSGDPKSKKAGDQLKYSRDKAEVDARQQARDAAYAACLCPSCGSNQVLVEAPR